MFAIYDSKGRRFRDTLKNLHKVWEIQASPGMQLRESIARYYGVSYVYLRLSKNSWDYQAVV